MPMINLPLCNLYYEVHGAGEPIVCISGFTADHHIWDILLPFLTPYFQVILLDNPACGQSSIPTKSFFVKDMADVIIELCDYLNISQAFFVGNSMGGAIAQQIAYDHPQRVKKVIISNSFSQAESMPYLAFADARVAWFKSNLSLEDTVLSVLPWVFSKAFLTKDNVDRLLAVRKNNPFPQSKAAYCAQLEALRPFDSRSWLNKVNVPCLFIAGDKDIICFEKDVKIMANQVKDSEYFLIDDVGHAPHIEKPTLFTNKMLEFFQQP